MEWAMIRALLSTVLAVAAIASASAAEIRIASWNIANLHHQPDVEQRPGIGTRRKSGDFDLLQRYAATIGRDDAPADIIALQEIGTQLGAEKIFPTDLYTVVMSKQYHRDVAAGQGDEIYTGVAIRKNRGITIVRQDDLEELAVPHTDGSETRPTRTGAALLLEVNGTRLWFVSVHLKSSCSHIENADTSIVSDCVTFWKQRVPLRNWIKQRIAEGLPFIIAGDFNRRFRQFGDEGPFWSALNNNDLNDPILVKHPETATRKCPTRKGTSTEPIDWIVLDAGIADLVRDGSYWERRFSRPDVDATGGKTSQRLSDHCPINIVLEF
jgi:endonuclease/exonuclease/phosphatase family metal-dependent hydrolase